MVEKRFFRMESVAVIDVGGADAATIVHNLTTNEVKSLQTGEGRETFVTDVRGKTLGHVYLFRTDSGFRMIGPAGQSERIAAHIDRYTILEDATVAIRDGELAAFALTPGAADHLPLTKDANASDPKVPVRWTGSMNGLSVELLQTSWLGPGTCVAVVPVEQAEQLQTHLDSGGLERGDDDGFHSLRVRSGFPWYGIDLDETNLPQEADRDSCAVSFTKGCYLGQETVARLDALGQVQKKLVGWSIRGAVPEPGDQVVSGEKTVGRLTSIASVDGGAEAIGMARRSHFDKGSTGQGVASASGESFQASVI